MEAIKIPEIDCRQANFQDVIKFLQDQSVENDTTSEGKAKGVNIILNLQAEGTAGSGGAGAVPLITFNARYISLLEALNIVTRMAGLEYQIKGSVVMVIPIGGSKPPR